MTVKLLVVYPPPANPESFDKLYREEHIPMGQKNLVGATKIETVRVLGAPVGTPTIYQISEVTFPSLEALQTCAATDGAQQTLAHAVSISTGGGPQFLIVQ